MLAVAPFSISSVFGLDYQKVPLAGLRVAARGLELALTTCCVHPHYLLVKMNSYTTGSVILHSSSFHRGFLY